MVTKAQAREVDASGDESAEEAGGVQAVETGMRLLEALIELGPTPMLKTIAEHAGMAPPKAHRYLASYCRTRLVERNPSTGGYRLGPLAVRLGLAALRHLDVVNVATPTVESLRDELGFSVGLAVWGTYGPTFVRMAETDSVVILSVRPGSVMPILSSATGRVFGAYLPEARTRHLVKAELLEKTPTAQEVAYTGRSLKSMRPEDIEAIFRTVREQGVANVAGDLNAGIHALAAPIFDHDSRLVGSLSVFGGAGLLDIDPDGGAATSLKDAAMDVSRQLGLPIVD